MSTGALLQRLSQAFQELDLPYMVVGSVASSYYGPMRMTRDIDIVIAPDAEQLRKLASYFPDKEFYFDTVAALDALKNRSMFNVLHFETGWKIDLIIAKPEKHHRIQFERRQLAEIEGVRLFVLTAEDLIVSKLEWAQLGESRRQLEDVAGVLKARCLELDMAYIEKWISQLGLDKEWRDARAIAGIPGEG